MSNVELFAAMFVTLYVAHHVGDYWVQTDDQARRKGDAGAGGVLACLGHVCSYVFTQWAFIGVTWLVLGWPWRSGWGLTLGLLVSGVTHYFIDRREHGVMFWLARRIPGKAAFLKLGIPREPLAIEMWGPCPSCEGRGSGGIASDESTNGLCWDCRAGGQLPGRVELNDNPSLGTGAWALDQSAHIVFSVFVPALLMAVIR